MMYITVVVGPQRWDLESQRWALESQRWDLESPQVPFYSYRPTPNTAQKKLAEEIVIIFEMNSADFQDAGMRGNIWDRLREPDLHIVSHLDSMYAAARSRFSRHCSKIHS